MTNYELFIKLSIITALRPGPPTTRSHCPSMLKSLGAAPR